MTYLYTAHDSTRSISIRWTFPSGTKWKSSKMRTFKIAPSNSTAIWGRRLFFFFSFFLPCRYWKPPCWWWLHLLPAPNYNNTCWRPRVQKPPAPSPRLLTEYWEQQWNDTHALFKRLPHCLSDTHAHLFGFHERRTKSASITSIAVVRVQVEAEESDALASEGAEIHLRSGMES